MSPQPAQRIPAFEPRRSLDGSCVPLCPILPSGAAFSSAPKNPIVPSPAASPPTPAARSQDALPRHPRSDVPGSPRAQGPGFHRYRAAPRLPGSLSIDDWSWALSIWTPGPALSPPSRWQRLSPVPAVLASGGSQGAMGAPAGSRSPRGWPLPRPHLHPPSPPFTSQAGLAAAGLFPDS